MKKLVLSFIILFSSVNLFAQKQVILTIKHKLGQDLFAINQPAQNNLSQDFKISRVDYYISKITIIHDSGLETPVTDKYILVRGTYNLVESLGIFNDITNIEGIKFHIGVDSPNNNADPTLWPTDHPLYLQSPSMHWGWSSGYRFVALEGKAGSNYNITFQMHGLGNSNYFEQTVLVNGVNTGNDITVNLDADYVEAVKSIDLNAGPIDHGVNETDLTVLTNFRDRVFKAGTGIPTAIENVSQNLNYVIYPSPSNGSIHLDINENNMNLTSAILVDVTGRIVNEFSLNGKSDLDFVIENKGIYFLNLYSNNKSVSTNKLVIQ